MIVGDWGTSRLRLFRIADGAVAERLEGPGIGRLEGSPADTLRRTARPWWDRIEADGLLLAGMAGSRNGLVEAPYLACPAGAEAWASRTAATHVDRAAIRIAPGLRCGNLLDAPDVMRGEETQIFGALRLRPELARGRWRLILPGTHSKWVEVADGRVLRFHTFFTGELFALLRERSSLTRAGDGSGGEDEGYAAGLARAGRADITAALFEARAAQLLDGRSGGWAIGFLSGLLIGSELREGLRLAGTGDLALVGDPALCDRYARALATWALPAVALDGDACVVAGLAMLGEEVAG